jgi:hypothetical protein
MRIVIVPPSLSHHVLAVVAVCFLCFTALENASPSRSCPIRFDGSSSSTTIKYFYVFVMVRR